MAPLTMNVIHLDIDAFFAAVEQRDDRTLQGRPVAVGSGVVASCSYESRRYGVRTGMRLSEARQRCRELIVLPGAYPRYEQAARHVLAICMERTPIVEVSALDDLYLDMGQVGDETPEGREHGGLTPSRSPSSPELEGVARQLREAVRDEVHLSVCLGSGSNKMIARV